MRGAIVQWRIGSAAGAQMKHDATCETPISARVLDVQTADVVHFVRERVKDRSLSDLVKELNHDVLFGTDEQRRRAENALRHIGFV